MDIAEPNQKVKKCFFALIAALLMSSLPAFAQYKAGLRFSIREKQAGKYKAFIYPVPAQPDYSNYPLTSGQIRDKKSSMKAYNRAYNTLTNRNKNGFVGNLLGLQRVQRPRPDLRF